MLNEVEIKNYKIIQRNGHIDAQWPDESNSGCQREFQERENMKKVHSGMKNIKTEIKYTLHGMTNRLQEAEQISMMKDRKL